MAPLEFDAAYATLPGNGWLTEDEARLLWDAVPLHSDVVEIGTYHGRSACLLAHRLAHFAGKLFCCDPFFDGHHFTDLGEGVAAYREVRELLGSILPAERFAVLPCRDEELARLIGHRSFGLVYCDGDHSYEATRDTLTAWSQHAFRLAVHDYAEAGGGAEVKRAVEDALPDWHVSRRAGRMIILDRTILQESK